MEMGKIQVRAYQIWAVLTYAASKSHIVTYKELDNGTGLVSGGTGKALALLKKYCESQGLPPITALVVDEKGGVPSNLSGKDLKEWPATLRKIFTHKWKRKDSPKMGALQ